MMAMDVAVGVGVVADAVVVGQDRLTALWPATTYAL
jgi:hypothetical protein